MWQPVPNSAGSLMFFPCWLIRCDNGKFLLSLVAWAIIRHSCTPTHRMHSSGQVPRKKWPLGKQNLEICEEGELDEVRLCKMWVGGSKQNVNNNSNENNRLGLNSGLCTCKAGALPLEPHLQSILLWLFWRWGSLDHDHASLSHPSS
jgi:hypothetical protein